MITITTLWLPILLSGILVFVASSLIHMVLGYHNSDWAKVPDEDAVMDALRPFDLPPDDYAMPYPHGPEGMRSEAYVERMKKGPVVFFTVLPNGADFGMGVQMTQWFAYTLLVSIVSAYLGGRMLAPGTDYLEVFRVTGTVAFASYSMALMQRSIWYRQRWSTTLKSMFDGLVFACLTGGAFGWLWPVS